MQNFNWTGTRTYDSGGGGHSELSKIVSGFASSPVGAGAGKAFGLETLTRIRRGASRRIGASGGSPLRKRIICSCLTQAFDALARFAGSTLGSRTIARRESCISSAARILVRRQFGSFGIAFRRTSVTGLPFG